MNIDSFIDQISEVSKKTALKRISELIDDQFLYFFLIDDGSFSRVTEIVNVDKDRPVTIPIINTGDKQFAVLYTNKKTAMEKKENNFKLAYAKGKKAFGFVQSAKKFDGLYLQGTNSYAEILKEDINKIIKPYRERE